MSETSREILLDSDDLEVAIEHALRIHRAAEYERARREGVADLATLREILEDCGLPPEDIDRAVASLPEALATRRQQRTYRRRLTMAALCIGVVVGFAVAGLLLRAPPPPRAFISLQRQNAEGPETHTWASASTLNGAVETRLAKAIAARGIQVVATLEPQTMRELYADGRNEPSMALVAQETGATLAVLGSVRCLNQGSIMGTRMLSLRGAVKLRAIDLENGQLLGQVEGDKVTGHIHPAHGCAKAIEKALDNVMPQLEHTIWPNPASGAESTAAEVSSDEREGTEPGASAGAEPVP